MTRKRQGSGSTPRFENIERLIGGEGDITIGRIATIRCAATAADVHSALAMLVRRRGETLLQLLERLDDAIGKAWTDEIRIDEING